MSAFDVLLVYYKPKTRADAVLSLKLPRVAWSHLTILRKTLKPGESYRTTRSLTAVTTKIT